MTHSQPVCGCGLCAPCAWVPQKYNRRFLQTNRAHTNSEPHRRGYSAPHRHDRRAHSHAHSHTAHHTHTHKHTRKHNSTVLCANAVADAFHASSGAMTAPSPKLGGSPRSAASTLRAIVSPTLAWASRVAAPMWGVAWKLSQASSALSADGGSCSKTSVAYVCV